MLGGDDLDLQGVEYVECIYIAILHLYQDDQYSNQPRAQRPV